MSHPESLDLQKFQTSVKEYFALDDEIKILETVCRNKKKRRQQLSLELIDTMKTQEIDNLTTSKGNLIMNCREQKIGLTKKFLTSTLTSFFASSGIDAEKALELMKLLEDRERVEKFSIKVCKDDGKKKKELAI